MKRTLSSVVSTLALLSVAAGAAAVNIRILESNRAESSVLTVQPAAETVTTATAAASGPVEAASGISSDPPTATAAPTSAIPTTPGVAAPIPATPNQKQSGMGRVVGAVAGGDDDDDDDDDDHRSDRSGKRGKFVPLSPQQASLLRVAALAQVSPVEARDAARGLGSADVQARVRDAAIRISVPLAEIASVTDVPSERGRRHGGNDDDDDDEDDDD